MTVLEAWNLTKTYRIDSREICVLDDVSLAVRDGEFLVITGASGSGKSTLLSLLSGIDRPTSGRIRIGDSDITDLPEDDLAPLRNRTIGFVFQAFHLVPALSALENVMFPAELMGDPQAGERARALLQRVGLAERLDSLPHQLSGGEKQRVALCRALVNQPRIVFADEPTGNLDSRNSQTILALLQTLRQEQRSTLVMATHSEAIARAADRCITLQDGRIVATPAQGPADAQ
ncbi:MAG: ABC transporter ATP-binding protein [Desulfobacteraceae bacterium]|nr:ABC transporter ATP-binding protein [Desulfobacteraceae bacterium]